MGRKEDGKQLLSLMLYRYIMNEKKLDMENNKQTKQNAGQLFNDKMYKR